MNYIDREGLKPGMRGGAATEVGAAQGVRKWPIQYGSIESVAILIDAVTILLASLLAGLAYRYPAPWTYSDLEKYSGSAVLVAVLFVALAKLKGMYRPVEFLDLGRQFRSVSVIWLVVFILLAVIVAALKVEREISFGAGALFALVGLTGLLLNRVGGRDLLAKALSEHRLSGHKVVVITDRLRSEDARGLLGQLANLGFRLDGHFTLPRAYLPAAQREAQVQRIIDHILEAEVDEVIIGADLGRWGEVRQLVGELSVLPNSIKLIPFGATSELLKRPAQELGYSVCVELHRGPLSTVELFAKRSFDLVVAGVSLVVLLPLFAVVALAIKLETPGPVLFRQHRCGFNGKKFLICKFRTMKVLENGQTIVQAHHADDRITVVGRWLRRTSIDELPQLFNVLGGTMSIIGPRPHAVAHENAFNKSVWNYAYRRRVKPGLTGWAQIHGCRGPTPTVESIKRRVAYDLWYIENWSLLLDLVIIIKTPLEIIRGHNAI